MLERVLFELKKNIFYKNVEQTLMSLLEDYCSNSTLHGVRYFVDKNRHWLERFWWIAGFVMSIICCGALIHKVYVNWDQRSIIVSISEEVTPVWHIPLPAVTICPVHQLPSYQVNISDLYVRWLNAGQDLKTPFNLTDEQLKIFASIYYMCNSYYDFLDIRRRFSAHSAIEFAWELAKQSKLYSCEMTGYFFQNAIGRDRNTDEFQCELKHIMTKFGLCFTFNMLNAKETYSIESTEYSRKDHNITAQWNLDNGYDPTINGIAYPYRVAGSFGDDSLKIHYADSNVEPYETCLREKSFVAFHLPGEIPQLNHFKFEYMNYARITIKPTIITTSEELRSYHPNKRKCYFNADRQLRFLKVYTQGNCELECLSNFTLNLCGCVPHFLLRDANTPICRVKNQCSLTASKSVVNGQIRRGLDIGEKANILFSKLVENCNCLPECNSIKYDTTMTTTTMSSDDDNGRWFNTISLAFDESKFMSYTRSEVYGTIDFIANCGGLLGLFVGASFLSVLELLYYCSLRLYCTRLIQKRENKVAVLTV